MAAPGNPTQRNRQRAPPRYSRHLGPAWGARPSHTQTVLFLGTPPFKTYGTGNQRPKSHQPHTLDPAGQREKRSGRPGWIARNPLDSALPSGSQASTGPIPRKTRPLPHLIRHQIQPGRAHPQGPYTDSNGRHSPPRSLPHPSTHLRHADARSRSRHPPDTTTPRSCRSSDHQRLHRGDHPSSAQGSPANPPRRKSRAKTLTPQRGCSPSASR